MKTTLEIIKVNKLSGARLVEPATSTIIQRLQQKNIIILGLTARDDGFGLSEACFGQWNDNHIEGFSNQR